jgi:hypothetical protein
MPRPKTYPGADRAPGREPAFAVVATRVIGTVQLTEAGEITPYEAALTIIGRHGEPGTFTFPAEDGSTVEVTIDHRDGGDDV